MKFISETIAELNKKINPLFIGTHLSIIKSKDNNYKYIGTSNYICTAINRDEEVKVINLFDDYWLYIYLIFKPDDKRDIYYIEFSLSLFYGKFQSIDKQQIFRAEWDNYQTPCSKIHPQPHWHFYINSDEIERTKSFEENIQTSTSNGFTSSLGHEVSKNKIFRNIHFAMSENWKIGSGKHIHEIEDSDKFVNWVFGLTEHILAQLKYIEKGSSC